MRLSLDQLRQHGIEIRHYIPGRLRFSARQLRANNGLGEKIVNEISKVPGITKVEYHSASTSILVTFDPAQLALPENSSLLLNTLQQLFPAVGTDVWRALWAGRT